jgi:hypothetical protein
MDDTEFMVSHINDPDILRAMNFTWELRNKDNVVFPESNHPKQVELLSSGKGAMWAGVSNHAWAFDPFVELIRNGTMALAPMPMDPKVGKHIAHQSMFANKAIPKGAENVQGALAWTAVARANEMPTVPPIIADAWETVDLSTVVEWDLNIQGPRELERHMQQYGLSEEVATQILKVRDIPPFRGEIYDRYIENDLANSIRSAYGLFTRLWRQGDLTVQQMVAEFTPNFVAGVEAYKEALKGW